MKTTIVILSIALLACLVVIFWPNEPTDSEQDNIELRDNDLLKAARKAKAYDSIEVIKDKIQAELITSKAQVKRSEEKLSELLKRERHAQIENKKVFQYSDFQLDSAFRVLFPLPDSLYR